MRKLTRRDITDRFNDQMLALADPTRRSEAEAFFSGKNKEGITVYQVAFHLRTSPAVIKERAYRLAEEATVERYAQA